MAGGKVFFVVGARPQFVKLAPLVRVVSSNRQCVIVHTGQHYDRQMSDLLFEDLQIPRPDYNLGIGSGGHGEQTGRMLVELERVLLQETPAVVVVFGDTNSTLAGSLAAVKLGIPCVHVEAGLRSWNRSMPEEINRVASDHTCDALYAPTLSAMRNLESESLAQRALLTGDVMADALEDNIARAHQLPSVAKRLGVQGNYWLLTLHRPYNVDSPLRLQRILEGVDSLGWTILFPAHPRTANILRGLGGLRFSNVCVVEPQGYLDFLQLQHASQGIMTDSGGIQKEAYLMRKPCITLRTETEWVETVESGWNALVPALSEGWLETIKQFTVPTAHPDIFGRRVAEGMCYALRAF